MFLFLFLVRFDGAARRVGMVGFVFFFCFFFALSLARGVRGDGVGLGGGGMLWGFEKMGRVGGDVSCALMGGFR